MRVRRALSNSFGFGGHNACIVLGAFGTNGH
jgi:3-oxoacyl-(acyl-carrier-protein) synthase